MTDTNIATATLVSGFANLESADLVNLSISSARARYAQAASIPTGARAVVNGASAEDNYILRAGDTLVFDQPTGTKGQ